MKNDLSTDASVAGGAGLALLGTTCCALPIALVALGLGSTVASAVSALPWLVTLSQYKHITFFLTAVVLGYSAWRVERVSACDHRNGGRLRIQRLLLWCSAGLLILSLFTAYGLLPLVQWYER